MMLNFCSSFFGVSLDRQKMVLNIRRRRLNRLCTLLVTVSLVLVMVMTRTVVERYYDMRKYFRLQEYSSQVQDISNSLHALEESVSSLEGEVGQLQKYAKDVLDKLNASMTHDRA